MMIFFRTLPTREPERRGTMIENYYFVRLAFCMFYAGFMLRFLLFRRERLCGDTFSNASFLLNARRVPLECFSAPRINWYLKQQLIQLSIDEWRRMSGSCSDTIAIDQFSSSERDTENGTIPNFQPSSSVSAKSFGITEPLWSEELCNARFLKKPPRWNNCLPLLTNQRASNCEFPF